MSRTPHFSRRAAWQCTVWLLCLVLLSACKTELFTKQTEGDANDMVSALLERGVQADKVTPDSGKTWNVVVDEAEVVVALSVLRANGLPQDRHVTLGDMFKKEGLISTPTEERVRFIHGVTQELSDTLSKIDGVVVAKVHIVLPNNDPMATVFKPSSASVFVKYRAQADLTALTPSIKNLVARSVEGLSYENVTVTLVPGTLLPPVLAPKAGFPWGLAAGLIVLMLVGCGVAVVVLRPQWLPQRLVAVLPEKLRQTLSKRRGGDDAAAAAGA